MSKDYVIEHHTWQYCGEYAQEVVIALEPVAGETVDHLVERVLADDYRTAHIVLRVAWPS